jgi:hydrogenase nickel incorporation protein HypB
MCAVCGCGKPDDPAVEHEHVGPDGRVFRHAHGHEHEHEHGHETEAVHAHGEVPGLTQGQVVQIHEDILGKNDELARANRARFDEAGTHVVNLMSSPGSGKTTLLLRTLHALGGRVPTAVIEGDQQTTLDADRIRAAGAPAVQVNTGRGCHLDASLVARALDRLPPPRGILFIENVGNLVCPAGFDLGEHRKVVIASVTEGEDKPLKYPDMFRVADAVVVSKADLLPHLAFDVEALFENVRRVAPRAAILKLSATTGEGLDAWLDWLLSALNPS